MNLLDGLFRSSNNCTMKEMLAYPVFIWQIPCGSVSINKKGGLVVGNSTAKNIRANCQYLDNTYSHRYMIFNFSPLMMDLEEACKYGELMDYSKQSIEDFRLLMELCFTIMKWTLAADQQDHYAVLTFLEESRSVPHPNYAAMIATCYHIFAGGQSNGGSYTLEFMEGQLGIRRSMYHAASQESYVNYFQLLLDLPIVPNTQRLRLTRVSLHNMDLKGVKLGLHVEYEGKTSVFSDPTAWVEEVENEEDGTVRLSLNTQVCLFGDFSVSLLRYEPLPPPLQGHGEPPRRVRLLARCAFSTVFLHQETHQIRARDMDYATQNNLPSDSFMLLHFEKVDPLSGDDAYIGQITQRVEQSPRHQMFLLGPDPLPSSNRYNNYASSNRDDDYSTNGARCRADEMCRQNCVCGENIDRPLSRTITLVTLPEEEKRRSQEDYEVVSLPDKNKDIQQSESSNNVTCESLVTPSVTTGNGVSLPSYGPTTRLSRSERRRQRGIRFRRRGGYYGYRD
ncbi:formin [Trypanosoma theileri]|uniref:Formin n=1 Tax=Trypanosoma theileri TaxID=67003 RepID=A0A1X0ND12_9TRYP|nr:formin [Trypanosoma theileri]ORC77869.1 formin [Trypanosoma theileri]